VRGHRGSIVLESVPGRGTTFRVFLPISATPAAGAGGDATREREPRGHGLVLVVDDDPTVCAVARHMLERRGYEVQVASDGVSGLEQFYRAAGTVRLALIDLTMPRMGGEELVAAIRAVDRRVPLILMSGFSESEMTGRFAANVVTACVQKPFRVEEIDRVLSRVMRRRAGRENGLGAFDL
jgi:CheY-like chemotaxis protein